MGYSTALPLAADLQLNPGTVTARRMSRRLPRTVAGAICLLVLGPWAALGSSSTHGDETPPGLPEGTPSMGDVISLWSVSDARISPGGESIAYVQRSADWEANRYSSEIWLVHLGGDPFQLTRTPEAGSSSPRWSPDGRWIGFLSDRAGESQVFRIDPRGGEARPITTVEGGVNAFRWSPDARQIAFIALDAESEASALRKKTYGEFAVEDRDLRHAHLWVIGIEEGAKARRLTGGDDRHVLDFEWSPDGSRIAFSHRPSPGIDDFPLTDISLVWATSSTLQHLVSEPGPDASAIWSPDGSTVAFAGQFGSNPYYGTTQVGLILAAGGMPGNFSPTFDESVSPFAWTDRGIWFMASQRTERAAFVLNPDGGSIERVQIDVPMTWSVDLSADGSVAAIVAEGPDRLAEVYRADLSRLDQVELSAPLTSSTEQVADWALGTRELVEWQSRDGTTIEGVLLRPEGHDGSVKAPLLVVIHGGPTGTSRPQLLPGSAYPVAQWLARGALILMPNYRGSAGYGGAFRQLNVRNLGVGDAWDVESGVEALIERGWVDPDKVGAMGWSQGGYISSFLATTSELFAAISEGAGISDWMTYYVNTDIHGFTRNYLGATPWDDPEIYQKTSPMHYIKEARTPTLIQHGEFDKRVPPPNAYQLFQGLQDVGVETKLVIYKGFGHGITKPKERLAAQWHNWQWFEKHLWGREVEMPMPEAEASDGE